MKTIALLLLFSFVVSVACAEQISGRVVGVTDGDTLTVLTSEKRQVKVRLAEIDTPESRQPYGTRAKQALSDLVFGKAVRVDIQTTDRYGRSVGRVYVGKTDVNAAMVAQGAAWVYRQYSHDPQLLDLEEQAKTSRRGLWALPESEQTPPWEWRHRGGSATITGSGDTPSDVPKAAAVDRACTGKRTCQQMANCAEAQHYLTACGVSSLDRDHDGIPCESICR